MDSAFIVSSNVYNTELAAKQRFESFKMGGGAPAQSLQISMHSHGRSRSRNNSISSFPTLSVSASAPSLPPSLEISPSNVSVLPNPPSKRPNSHHRRRSSVSTRCESAELMGVSLPELPTAHSDDNINLGDRDSIRRRALWALEGKPDLAFSKVEIPDIASPDTTKSFELPTKPSFPPGTGLNTHGISSLMGKRDSFKMFGSPSASKDQLGTLLEEEEEEEEEEEMQKDDGQHADASLEEHKEVPRAFNGVPARIPPRPRPASLNLRPLSLVQGSVVNFVGGVPTPVATPSPRPHGQKPSDDATSTHDFASTNASFPHLANFPPASMRFSYSSRDSTSSLFEIDSKRRSSISYKNSSDPTPRDMVALPTPEMTPNERRFSLASDSETLVDQPLSAAEQHFLFKSHNVLLTRITELERTLRNRASRSRHVPYTSDISVASSGPSDEMLHLISDLRAERDELKRDVDGWRQRVADADKQASILATRIETERREAWVARSKLGMLEVEKSGLEESVEEKDSALARSVEENATLMRERDGMKDEIMKLNARLKDADVAVAECARLRAALDQERARREELEKLLDDAGLLNTPTLPHGVKRPLKRPPFPVSPRPRGLGFQSIDSESSTTDVESVDDTFTKAELTLDAVVEEDGESSDTENGLVGYEDEEDSDLSFSSPGGSSIGSGDELDLNTNVFPPAEGLTRAFPSAPTQPSHASRASLSKTWTFPRGKAPTPVKQEDEVDRFFGCLDDADGSPVASEEMSKTAFSSAFGSVADDDELPPFFIPSNVGVVVESTSVRNLGVVPEEVEDDGDADDEDELIGEEVEGGIRFIFNGPSLISVTPPLDICITPPPPEIRVTPPPPESTTPAYPLPDDFVIRKPVPFPEMIEDEEEDNFSTFVFPQTKAQPKRPEPMTPPTSSSPPTSSGRTWNRNNSPPSSIPRATSLLAMASRTPPAVTFTPSKISSGRVTAPSGYSGMTFATPPAKKGSSFTPQSVTTPKCSAPTKPRPSAPLKKNQSGVPNGSTSKPHSKLSMINDSTSASRCTSFAETGDYPSEVNGLDTSDPSPSSVCETFYAQNPSSLSSIMPIPLAARLPFQRLSTFLPFSWTPGATAVASCIVPSSSSNSNVDAADSAPLLSNASNGAPRPTERRFVSKDQQLEKLRTRLSFEQKNGMRVCSMVNACKGCSAGTVYL